LESISFNYAAVIAAAVITFAVGGLWYSPLLFARAWMQAADLDEARLKRGSLAAIFFWSFVCALVMAFNLAAFLGPKATPAFGAFAGLAAGLGWVAMSLGVVYLFERRPLRLWLIHAGYTVVSYTLMGALLGTWR